MHVLLLGAQAKAHPYGASLMLHDVTLNLHAWPTGFCAKLIIAKERTREQTKKRSFIFFLSRCVCLKTIVLHNKW